MKLALKLVDIEVSIDDPDEKDRYKLIGDALGCIDALIEQRIKASYQFEGAEDETSSLTDDTRALTPDIHNLKDKAMLMYA